MSFRVGTGMDVHAFAPDIPLWLCGIPVPHTSGLRGHSDGDAALHAIADALLGATAQGDIGTWFPSSDPVWRGAQSSDLLARIWRVLAADGWHLENVDVTIVAVAPQIAPYRQAMRERIAQLLQASVSIVSVKATTTDGLGFLGRGEGLEAVAAVLLSRADS